MSAPVVDYRPYFERLVKAAPGRFLFTAKHGNWLFTDLAELISIDTWQLGVPAKVQAFCFIAANELGIESITKGDHPNLECAFLAAIADHFEGSAAGQKDQVAEYLEGA